MEFHSVDFISCLLNITFDLTVPNYFTLIGYLRTCVCVWGGGVGRGSQELRSGMDWRSILLHPDMQVHLYHTAIERNKQLASIGPPLVVAQD